ncbi:MAG TPA: hypothetical protein VKF32_06475, partial [Thermoanaerobaculia bacterium]|nr:hypothetical protein [Thermoanaerobaculia bacterium]
ESLRVARVLEREGRAEPDTVAQSERALAEGDEELAKASLALVTARAGLLSLRGDLPRALVP